MFVEPIIGALASTTSLLKLFEYKVVRTWIVFVLCWAISLSGVAASFLVVGSSASGYRLWGVSIVIAVGMIGLNYGQKYVKEESRLSFTPVDFISYLIQGFLWPTTWPTLAKAIGVSSEITAPINPAGKTGFNLFEAAISLFS
jgi:hypothetical protein